MQTSQSAQSNYSEFQASQSALRSTSFYHKLSTTALFLANGAAFAFSDSNLATNVAFWVTALYILWQARQQHKLDKIIDRLPTFFSAVSSPRLTPPSSWTEALPDSVPADPACDFEHLVAVNLVASP